MNGRARSSSRCLHGASEWFFRHCASSAISCIIFLSCLSGLRATEFIDWELVLESGIHAQEIFGDHASASLIYSRIHQAETASTSLLCHALARDVACRVAMDELVEARQLFQRLTHHGKEAARWSEWLRGKVPEVFYRKPIAWTAGETWVAQWKHPGSGRWAGVSLLTTDLVTSEASEYWRVSIQILARESMEIELEFDRDTMDLMASRMRRKQWEGFERRFMPESEHLLPADWIGDAEVIAQMLRHYPLSLGYASDVETWSAQDGAWSRIAFDVPSLEVVSGQEYPSRIPVFRVVLEDWQPRITLWIEDGGDHFVRRMQVEDWITNLSKYSLGIDDSSRVTQVASLIFESPHDWIGFPVDAKPAQTAVWLLPGSELRLWMQFLTDLAPEHYSARQAISQTLVDLELDLVSEIREKIHGWTLVRISGRDRAGRGGWVGILCNGSGACYKAIAVGQWQELEGFTEQLDHMLRMAATGEQS